MRASHLVKLQLMSLAMLALCACGGSQAPPPPPPPQSAPGAAIGNHEPANGAFVGRVWRSSETGKPLGTVMIFLPDRLLLMDSCFETFRISQWGVAGNNIRWLEDTVPIEAEVIMPSPNELTLRVGGKDQTFVAMTDAWTCPDMPK
ncbi:MAG TPA: hypothetical protein VJS12_19415 [Steroidobacteraceae bacterium]|nr:hypothetical protein [Steroidobacteraceae bacterium]